MVDGTVLPGGVVMGVRVGALGLRPALAGHAEAALRPVGAQVVPLPAVPGWEGPLAVGSLALVLLDGGAGDGGSRLDPHSGEAGEPVPRVVVHLPGEGLRAGALAAAVGARAVVELPTAGTWLAGALASREPARPPALVVVGAVGGAGASTLAIAAAAAATDCLLVDADPATTGLDLPLGMTELPGARWTGIPTSADPLDPASLRAALPTVAGCAVLTGEGLGQDDPRVAAVVQVARRSHEHVVVDAGRALPAWLGPTDPVVVLAPATLAGVVGARRLVLARGAGPLVLAIRETPWLEPAAIAAELGLPDCLVVPALRRVAEASQCGDLLGGRPGRAVRRLGAQVWQAVG
jgi:hypothetical protein